MGKRGRGNKRSNPSQWQKYGKRKRGGGGGGGSRGGGRGGRRGHDSRDKRPKQTFNVSWAEYYKAQNIVPAEEFDALVATLQAPLPVPERPHRQRRTAR